MMSNQGIPRADIIRVACNSDFTISDAQLHRWRSRGLIPRPKIRRLGRGRGTASFYPVGTDLQVIALCELLATTRNLDLAAMALFFQGYPVSLKLLKSFSSEPLVVFRSGRLCHLAPLRGHHSIHRYCCVDASFERRPFDTAA